MEPALERHVLTGLAELTLESDDLPGMERFYREALGLWSPGAKAFGDRAGNMVEAWDFFAPGAGAREGVRALR